MGVSLWLWEAGGGFAPADPDAAERAPLLLADSWLLAEGRVRALDRHAERFAAGVRDLAGDGIAVAGEAAAPDAGTLAAAVRALLPAAGEWFPRLELVADGPEPTARATIRFRLRPASPRHRTVEVWVPPFPDPRTDPVHKGPDLALLGSLRERARDEADCDELLLLDPAGHVVEAANSSVLWWEDGALWAPASASTASPLPSLPGVTAALVTGEAARRGIPVHKRAVRPAELAACETWLVNALHAIRTVTRWAGAGISGYAPLGGAGRADAWHDWLDGGARASSAPEVP